MSEVTEEYKESIKWLAENRINEVIYNSSEEHAVIILSELIRNAESYVHIVCKNMNPNVTDDKDYLSAVEKFLNDDRHEIKILLTEKPNENFKTRKIADLFRKHESQVKIKHFESGEKIVDGDSDSPVNWTVSDGRAFRFEENEGDCVAIGNFNDPYLAGKFSESFNTFFNSEEQEVAL